MDNELQIFDFNNDEVRTILIDDEPYFVGKDIANVLGYKNGSRDVNAHVDSEDMLKYQISTAGQMREQIVINESGVYSMIFGSELDSAAEFKHWVTKEVLPSIRKTGAYQAKPLTLPEQIQTVAQGYMEIEKDVNGLKDDVNDLKENFGLPGGKRRSLLSARSKQVTTLLGGHDSNAYSEISRKVFARMGHDFKERFEVARYEDVPMSRFDEAMEYTKHWQLPTNLALDVRDLNSQTELAMEA